MSNRIEQLLAIWQGQKTAFAWVLATVIETQGSSYRKSGAMMLINSLGQYYGLLSGGCLEADIMRQARQCLDKDENLIITYDMREDDDLGYQLGIGCGGMVKILLQPINQNNNWLALDELQTQLTARQTCYYQQNFQQTTPENKLFLAAPATTDSAEIILHTIKPTPSIAIFGGGTDALPLVNMAHILGWHIIVVDERVNYARPAYFKNAAKIIQKPISELTEQPWLQAINAVVIMNHSIRLDAQALRLVQHSSATFVGMLGPKHRTEKVLKEAGLTSLIKPLANPVGLDIGGELPESIALSILSQAHACLAGRDAQPLVVKDFINH